MPSISEYCSNPSQYVNSYPPETISYWNNICKDQKNGQKEILNDIDKLAGIAAKESKAGLYVLGDALINMITGMLTPEGLKMLGIFFGVDFGVKTLYKLLLKTVKNYISRGITEEITDLSAKVSAEAAIDAASSNAAVMASELAGEMGSVLAGEQGVVWVLETLGDVFAGIMNVFMLLQLVTMIFEAWDPCKYNVQLSKVSIDEFTSSFNKMYRENGVVAYNSFTDVYGRTEYLNVWPIDYTATQFLLDIHTNKEYKLAYTRYTAQYLSSLRVNSIGDPIYLPNGGVTISQMNSSHWRDMEMQLSNVFADGNTVVANTLIKFWPLFVILAIVILIFIIYIVK
jgi:hypothetical protein